MLSVIYRACHWETNLESVKNQSRPDWFDKRKCWKSFYSSFGNNPNIDITVVFDGNKEHELAVYMQTFEFKNIIYLDEVGNKGSLLYCYDLMRKAESEYILLAEDDYLWLPDSEKILINGLERFGALGTLSLYNHPDRVFRNDDITFGHDYILAGMYCYWRTAESNTATFAIKTDIFKRYSQEFIDCHVQDRLLFTNLLKKYQLRHLTPVSERFGASHVNKFFPSLYIDWEAYNKTICLF